MLPDRWKLCGQKSEGEDKFQEESSWSLNPFGVYLFGGLAYRIDNCFPVFPFFVSVQSTSLGVNPLINFFGVTADRKSVV